MSALALRLIRENIKKHQRGEDATYLELGRCGLTRLPRELGECVWLETLILSNTWNDYNFEKREFEEKKSQNEGEPNRIASIEGVERLRLLKKLVVARHYSDKGENEKLRDLSPLSALTNLQKLDCSSNQISDLSSLSALTNLQQLSCSSNQISDLSPLAALTNLQQLDCFSNQISDLSPFAALTNLQNLSCSSNQISDLSPLSALTDLQVLWCYNNQISDLSSLSALTNLQKLYCSENKIADLSPLSALTNLQNLSCSSNQISDLSPLSALTNLQILYCQFNQISDLSPLSALTDLQELNCSDNRIADLSPLAALTDLQELNCSDNRISDLSPLAALTNLQKLYCQSNQISDLSPLAALTNLQGLYCSNNQISDLSPLLFWIKNGRQVKWLTYGGDINVAYNPLNNPPREVVEQGNAAILNYFAEKARTGTEKSLEAKVVLIGEGQAGKTSLRTRLLSPGAALPNKEDRTKGLDIEIEKYKYPLPGGEEMRLNVFDFGGQDHYKPLHRFFYSKNTLYVLVSKNGDAVVNDFDYWLDTAQLFGQNSPVLLVHNLFGDVRSSFNRSKYNRFDDIIKECLDVNLADFTDKRWNQVQSHIEYFASRLPHVHEEIPKSWANVRRALAARREEQVLDLEDYLALCALEENGAMDKERALRCSAYLHDIGIILHYQNDADLQEYVIVKNEWATEAAYRVIDDADIAKRNGHFHRQTDLPRIWCQPEYRRMRPQLLQLMKHFRLCYPLKVADEFIAPQLLPVSPPEGYAWPEAPDLTMYVEYEFMPPGLMAQLIVECHLLIADERRLVWRDGAVLELPGGEARAEILLQKRGGKQTIGIRAQGRKRRDLMMVVNTKLEELHQTFGSGLKVEKKIPCVCPQCEKTDDKWFFNLSELENRLKAGRKSKECEKSFDAVSIDALLGNVFSEEVRKRGGSTVPRAFFSYSKKDIEYLTEFKKHLHTSQRNGDILLWDDTKIRPGEEWDAAIKSELAQADIIFLLVSVDFLNTSYIWDTEIEAAMRRHEAGEVTVIPIKIRKCDWSNTPFAKLQGLPRKDGIIKTPRNDEMWTMVVQEIREELKSRKG